MVKSYIMDHQKAIAVLQNLLNRNPLDNEEKEAVATAIGILSWTALSKSRIQSKKAKRDKDLEW